jgi:retron-type reverse transcriptase
MIDKLNDLHAYSVKNPGKKIDRQLYKMINKDLLLLAYINLKYKPGNLTRSINPETFCGISDDFLNELAESIKEGTFRFKPSRQVKITKASGGTRPLRIAPPKDKIVQEAIRLILNAIFESRFLDSSHGFRPGRSCHTALKKIAIG